MSSEKGRWRDRFRARFAVLREAPQFAATLAAIFVLLSAIYFLLLFDGVGAVAYCCDARAYLKTAEIFGSQGLFADFPFLGYRSYLNYYFALALTNAGRTLLGTANAEVGYALGSAIFYCVSGVSLIIAFWRRRTFLSVFLPLYLSPFVVAYVPYPLQESQALLVLLPLLVTVTMWPEHRARSGAVVSGLFSGCAWMLKASFSTIALVGIVHGLLSLWKHATGRRERIIAASMLVAAFAVPVVPQSAAMFVKLGTLHPYPASGVLADQIGWGWQVWRYDTYQLTNTKWDGVGYKTPLPAIATTAIAAEIVSDPTIALGLGAGHLFAAFNYSSMKPYVADREFSFLPLQNLLVALIMFLGLSCAAIRWCSREATLDDFLLDGVVAATMVVLPFVAVETRFSILPLALLGVRAAQIAKTPLTRRERVFLVVGAALFAILFAVFCRVILQLGVVDPFLRRNPD